MHKKIIIRPFIYNAASAGDVSLALLILLLLQLIMLVATRSYNALAVIGASLIGSLCADSVSKAYRTPYLFSVRMSAVQGITAAMLLPATFPPVTVFFIAFFTMMLVKYMAGGFAYNWINAAVVVAAFAWIVGMSAFPSVMATHDILQIKNPSYILIQSGAFPILRFDPPITEAFNSMIFNFINISIPEGYISLLWDTNAIIPAFRFNMLTLLSSIVLFSTGMLSMIIPSCFVVVYALLVRFAGPLFCGGIPGQGDMILALLTGGTLFCAVFVVQWYGTVPLTAWGKAVYGVLCGILAFFIAGCGTSPIGMVFTVLCANIFSPLIQISEDKKNKKKLDALLARHFIEQEAE